MNEAIAIEMRFFAISILWGCLILVIYDLLRIFRNIIRHNKIAIGIEDILYWILCGVLIFKMMYKHYNGIIRAFSILGMFIGMLIYQNNFSEFIVTSISTLLKKIIGIIFRLLSILLRPLIWVKNLYCEIIGKRVRKIMQKQKKTLGFAIKSLKNIFKSSKISLSDEEKGDLLDEEKKKKK